MGRDQRKQHVHTAFQKKSNEGSLDGWNATCMRIHNKIFVIDTLMNQVPETNYSLRTRVMEII